MTPRKRPGLALAAVIVLAATGGAGVHWAWAQAQAENKNSSRSNRVPDEGIYNVPGSGPDLQFTSRIDASITTTMPRGVPADGRKRFELIVNYLLAQTKADLMASYDRQHPARPVAPAPK